MITKSIISAGIITGMWLALSSTVPAQAKTVTVTDAQNNGTVSLNVGDTLIVRLTANPGTGYTWRIGQNNPLLLQPIGTPSYENSNTELIGAPGYSVFAFQAVGVGGEGLALLYQDPSLKGIQAANVFRVLVVVNQGSQAKTVTVTERDNHGQVSLQQGDTLLVRLPANPTTGYGWTPSLLLNWILQPIGESRFERPEFALPGAASYQVFRFRAVNTGSLYVRLFYRRPFELNAPAAQKWYMFVTVTPALQPMSVGGLP